MNSRERFAALARTFPCLASAPIYDVDWNVDLHKLNEWSVEDCRRLVDQYACAFLLGLADATEPWDVGPFEMFDAIKSWDPAHLRAWKAWAADPWRP